MRRLKCVPLVVLYTKFTTSTRRVVCFAGSYRTPNCSPSPNFAAGGLPLSDAGLLGAALLYLLQLGGLFQWAVMQCAEVSRSILMGFNARQATSTSPGRNSVAYGGRLQRGVASCVRPTRTGTQAFHLPCDLVGCLERPFVVSTPPPPSSPFPDPHYLISPKQRDANTFQYDTRKKLFRLLVSSYARICFAAYRSKTKWCRRSASWDTAGCHKKLG